MKEQMSMTTGTNDGGLKKIYDKSVKDGYKGSYDDFTTYFNASDENRRRVYDKNVKNGYKGSYDDFISFAGAGQAKQQPTRYQLPTFQSYQRELDDSPASILSPTQLKIARGEIGEGDAYTLQPGEDIEAFTPLPNFTLEHTEEEKQQRQQQPKPQRQTMRNGGRMLGHNAALTRLAQDNGIATEGFENLNELGEDAMKIYALTPQGKADKKNMDNAAELAYDDFAADYLKNGSDQDIKAQLELGRQKQLLEQENAALAKDIEAWKAHPGTEQQRNALNARISDLNKRLGEYEAAVAQSDKAQEKVNEAFQKWLENDDYYKAVAQQYEQNYEATMGDWFDSAATPLYMQMTKDEIAKMKAYLDDENLNLDYRQRTAIKRRVKDAEAWVKAAEKNGWLDKTFAGMQGKGAGIDIATMFRGMGNSLTLDRLSFGIGDALDARAIEKAMVKVRDQGVESLTPEERALLESDAVLDLTKSIFNVDESAFNAGATTMEMLPFIAELWLSGGALGAIKGGVKGAIKGGAKGFGKGLKAGWKAAMKPTASQLGRLGEAGRFAPKTVGQVAKEVGMTAAEIVDNGLFYAMTTGLGHSVANTLEYMTPEMDSKYDFGTGKMNINGVAVDEQGNIKGGDKLGLAALKGFGMQAIEGGSEMLGEKALQPLIDRAGYGLRKLMGGNGRAMYKPYLRVVDDWIGHGALKNISGFGTEYAEELAGSVMRVITGLSTWDQEFNKQNLADTAYGLMPAQVAFAILGGGRMVGHARRSSQAKDLLDKYAPEQAAFYDRVAQMSTYDGADMLDRKTLEILKTIDEKKNNGTLTEEDQRKAAAELGMIFTMQEQIYMDEASAYMKDKQDRRMYEGVTSNLNKDNGKFVVARMKGEEGDSYVPVLSTKDNKAVVRLRDGKKKTVDIKDLEIVREQTPEEALQWVNDGYILTGYDYDDQTTPMAGSVYYDAEGNIPIVPGKGEVNITEVADNGDVTFTTEDGTTQTMNERKFYDYMRALRNVYEDTAGQLAAWRVEADTKGKTAAENDDPQAHYGVGREARMARRALANAIGEERMEQLERMDGEQLTREYMMADEKTQDLMYDWMQNRVGDSYGEAMNQRRQQAMAEWKRRIGRLPYDNGNVTTAVHNGNIIIVEDNDGQQAAIVDMAGNKSMVQSSELSNIQDNSLDSVAAQATMPQQAQLTALEQAYNGTTFQAGQEYTIGTDTNGEERKAIIVSVNEDGTISYATEYGYDKEGNPTPAVRSVKVATAEGFRDMTENARQQKATQEQGQREAAQQRANMGELRNGQRVTIMDGGHPVQGTVNMPYTGSQSVFTDSGKLVKFDTIDDLKKSIQDAANALQTEQQAAIEAVANRITELANAMPNARIKVVTDINELRPDAQEFAKQGRLEAYFDPDTNTVVFYAPGLVANNSNVDGKVIHEVVIHYGLKNMLGEKDYAALCLNIFNNVMDENDRAQYVQYVKDSHPNSNLTDEQIMAMAADEWLAFTYENRDIDSIKRESLLQTIVNFIVDLFKKAGVDLNRDEVMAELDQLVAASRDWLRGEQVNQEEKKEEAPKEEEKKEEPQPEPTKTREELIANAVQAAANFSAQGDPNFVKDNLDKAKKRVSNAKKRKPTSTDPAKRQEQIEKINTELAAAESELAFWNDVQAVINEAQLAGQTRLNEADQALQDLDSNLNPTVEAEKVHKFDKEPANADEAAADFLVGFVKKQHRINEQSLMQETGWSEDEVKNFRPATTSDGGMTLQKAAENLYNEYESEGSEHGWFKDPSEARDKLISVMQEAGKYGELANYINQRRGNDEATQQMQAALDANAQQLGYANAQDMHDKRMAEAQAKLEELKDEQGNLSEEALQQFKDFTRGLMIGQEQVQTESKFDRISNELGEREQWWEDRILDYITEHYPTQANVSGESKTEQGLAEREAMKNDPVLQEMRRKRKEELDEIDKRLSDAYREEEYLRPSDEPVPFSVVSKEEAEEAAVRYSVVTDPKEIERLDNEPHEIGYRTIALAEGNTMRSPMADRLGKGRGRIRNSSFELNQWERSDENPQLADDNGKIDLENIGNVDYNPYIHIRPDAVNTQFKAAWRRPELVYVRTQYPTSELTSGYKAEKAKLPVGRHDWSGGGELVLSRWDKPVEIVPWEEVADDWMKHFSNDPIHFDIISPQLLPILAARGANIVAPHKNMGKACNDAYNEWKNGGTRYSITPQQDADYMDAVNRGDMEAAQRMVLEAAKAAMPNTKVVDENGNPLLMSHNTNNEGFYTFDKGRIGTGQGQAFLGIGFNFSRGYGSSIYGNRNISAYLNAENPLRSDGKTLSKMDIRSIIMELNKKNGVDRIEDSWGSMNDAVNALYDYGGDLDVYATIGITYSGESVDVMDAFAKRGYDSTIEYNDNGEIMNAVVFDSNQIKSADPVTYDDQGNVIPLSKRFNKRSDDIRYSVVNRNQAIFVSNAARAVEGIKQEKATPEQWLKMIEKNGGLKAGEDKWLGLSEWLKGSDAKTLTKQEVLDFIHQNMIQIEETHYAETSEMLPEKSQEKLNALNEEFDELIWEGDEATGSIYTSDWVDYAFRQMVERYGDDFMMAFEVDGNGTNASLVPTVDYDGDLTDSAKYFLDYNEAEELPINSVRITYTTKGLDNKREIALTVPTIEPWNEGDEIHFGDAGEGRAVAWIRFGETTDADGKRVLVIDEIQSKRHQEGREKGYKKGTKEDVRKANEATIDAQIHYDTYISDLAEKYNCDRADVYAHATDAEIEEAEARMDAVSATMRAYEQVYEEANGVPAAPFEKNWMELAMKRMLRLAAEEGYDKVAWTTGEQQAERYDLTKVIDSIECNHVGKNGRKMFALKGLDYNLVVDTDGTIVAGEDAFVGKPLSDIVGKPLAEKMIGMEEGDVVEGDGLRIGGEGMKGFYDKMIPSFMNKYGKQWGVKVGEVTMPQLEEDYQTMHSIDVTDAMKESVMSGQLMFSFVGRSGAQRLDMADRAMTRLNNLHVARQMEEQGKDAKTTKMATGWERGKDGKWRYEIPEDNMEEIVKNMREPIVPRLSEIRRLKEQAKKEYERFEYLDTTIPARLDSRYTEEQKKKYREQRKERDRLLQSSHANEVDAREIEDNLRNEGVETTMGDILPKDSEVLKAYPQLKDIKVKYYKRDELKDGSYGSYNSDTKTLFIAGARPVTEIYSTLQHEIQHAIQRIEGFAQGGSPRIAAQAVKDMSNNAKIWSYKLMLDEAAKDNPGHAGNPEELLMDILDGLGYEHDGLAEYNARKDGFIPDEDLRKVAYGLFNGNNDNGTYEKSYNQWYNKLRESEASSYYEGTPFQLYKRLAGETEARNVQSRLGFTDEQRREILAADTEDVSRQDQLVMMAGDPVLYSISQAANTPQERLRLYDAMVGTKEVSSFVGRVTEGFYQSVVDGAIPLKRLQDVIAGRGKVTDAENAYLMEIARAARAKRLTDIAEKEYYEPMMKAIAALTGKTSKKGYYKAMRDVELYVLAKSGLERNQWFWDEAKKSDPNAQLEDKSGLTALAAEFGEKDFTAFAERLVADYEARHGQQKIDELWKCINAVSKNILDTELDGHLISQELHDDLLNRWKFYVPMRGFDEQVTSAFYAYQPSSATIRFENPFKKIKGRVSLADNPFVNLIRMTESAINLKGKNEVGLALLNLAASHDDNGLLRVGKAWEVKEVDPAAGEVTWKAAYPNLSNVSQADIPAAIDAFQKAMMRQAKTGDARPSSRTAGGVRIHPSDIDQHVLKVKVGGQTVDLYLLGNPKAFQALNPTGKSKAGEKLSGLTRSLSGLMTTYNPVFMVRNSIRDFKTAAIITYTRDGAAGMFNMMGQWFGNMNALRKLIAGNPSGDATLDRYWQEFLEFGGETGFTRSLNMEKQREDFNKKMFNLTRDKSGQAMHKITHWYFDWMEKRGNRYAEDITRFAVFCASRKQGRSAMQAAADAKNTTANFNKKGQSGFARFMSTNFAFFNAAIQGLNTSFHAFKDNPGRAATAAVSTMIYSMAIPFVNMCLLAMFGDDDDWRQYENMTQFVSNTHAVYYIPGAGFLTMPYPQDFVPFTSLGNIIWRNAAGFEKPLNGRSIFGNVMLQWFDTWADLLPVNAFEEGFGEMKDWKGVARALAPTWLSPVADVMLNRNFMGSQIRRKHFTLNDQKDLAPYWAEYDRNKNWWAYDIARLIAGGDEYRAGAAWRNVDPRQIIHLVEGYGGGTVKLMSDIAVYFEEMAKGDKPTLNQAPFIKKFWIQPNPDKYEGNLNGKLYEMAKYHRELEQQIKDLQKEADKAREDGNDKAAEKREKKIEEIQNSMEYRILTDYDVNGMMKDWREKRNDITNDETLSEEGKQDKIVTITYQKAAFLDGIWEEAFLGEEAPKRNWFSEFYRDASTEAYTHNRDKKGEQE